MQLRLMADDIIVSGTDGLFDNVFAEEVASLVTFARKRGDSPALAATVLASYTQLKAADTTHMSPFAYAAQVRTLRTQPILSLLSMHLCVVHRLSAPYLCEYGARVSPTSGTHDVMAVSCGVMRLDV